MQLGPNRTRLGRPAMAASRVSASSRWFTNSASPTQTLSSSGDASTASASASSFGTVVRPGRMPRLDKVMPNFTSDSAGSRQLLRQPLRQNPARDPSHRCGGQQQQPSDGRTADDQAHADPQHHAADEAADDPGSEAQIQYVAAFDHAVNQARGVGFDNSRPLEPPAGIATAARII